ncbi:MAG: hypothetical protein KKE16_04670 [Firmicutes bacterium]|nr:hypothetical protein [Bacillota bacterium]
MNLAIYAVNVITVVLLMIFVFETTFLKMMFSLYLIVVTSIFSYQLHKLTRKKE